MAAIHKGKGPILTHGKRISQFYNQWTTSVGSLVLGCVYPGDVYTLQGLSGCLPAFRERDSRGWLALHAAAVQPLRDILRVVLQGEGSTDWV